MLERRVANLTPYRRGADTSTRPLMPTARNACAGGNVLGSLGFGAHTADVPHFPFPLAASRLPTIGINGRKGHATNRENRRVFASERLAQLLGQGYVQLEYHERGLAAA